MDIKVITHWAGGMFTVIHGLTAGAAAKIVAERIDLPQVERLEIKRGR